MPKYEIDTDIPLQVRFLGRQIFLFIYLLYTIYNAIGIIGVNFFLNPYHWVNFGANRNECLLEMVFKYFIG